MPVMPPWIEPMRATLTDERFSDKAWIFEPKFDGERILTYRNGNSLQMFTRNHISANSQYPELVEALKKQTLKSYIVDGEVVAFKPGTTITSFSQLQQRMHVDKPSTHLIRQAPVYYYVFDILFLEGKDLRQHPLLERKQWLETQFQFNSLLRFTTHIRQEGRTYYRQACKLGWEGLIAKRNDSHYSSARSRDWLKFKCSREQEFVIGGFSDPERSRIEFGALLIGYYEQGQLRFAGKVGTGFDTRMLGILGNKLRALETRTCPFSAIAIPRHGLHWVKPELVAQIGFSEWTDEGKLRHPRFLGLRNDKPPKEVAREKPVPI